VGGAKFYKLFSYKTFCEHIRYLFLSTYVLHIYFFTLVHITNKIIFYIYVFKSTMFSSILQQMNNGLIVLMNQHWIIIVNVKVL